MFLLLFLYKNNLKKLKILKNLFSIKTSKDKFIFKKMEINLEFGPHSEQIGLVGNKL